MVEEARSRRRRRRRRRSAFDPPTFGDPSWREKVLFIGTQFSNLYTAADTPAEAAWL
jgi:hypothetical protein